jgi:hypothetical protein
MIYVNNKYKCYLLLTTLFDGGIIFSPPTTSPSEFCSRDSTSLPVSSLWSNAIRCAFDVGTLLELWGVESVTGAFNRAVRWEFEVVRCSAGLLLLVVTGWLGGRLVAVELVAVVGWLETGMVATSCVADL